MPFPRFLWPIFDHLSSGPGAVSRIARLFDHGLNVPGGWLKKYRLVKAASDAEVQYIQQRLDDIVAEIASAGITDELECEVKMLRRHLEESIHDAKELSKLMNVCRFLLRSDDPNEFDRKLRNVAALSRNE